MAEGLFDRGVFCFLQAFSEFAGQNVFLIFLGFNRRAEFRFHGFSLLAEQARAAAEQTSSTSAQGTRPGLPGSLPLAACRTDLTSSVISPPRSGTE